ncbi:hypothetical protein F4861DRAFT_531728 [Xylaria intraflava]|nr:hypothetical protein F4861DRAFT_531728 [Xylaria intraflava]
MASLLPQYVSPPSRPLSEHDLAELSPKPDDALLASPMSENAPNGGSSGILRSRGDSMHMRNKRNSDRVKASVTFQEPLRSPTRPGDTVHLYRTKKVYQNPDPNTSPPDIWRPSLPLEPHGSRAGNTSGQLPFFENMFAARPAFSRASSTQVDQTFKVIERRENQMQQELQQLLDAQDYALEKHLANTAPAEDAMQHSGTPTSDTPDGHVMPVRQPKRRHLSKREARLGISRCMSQLSDLKNEEEAYIATALAQRKAALSRIRNLSTKRNAIVAEMQAVETDRDQPFKNQIEKMEYQHRTVCEDIMNLEEKLRDLRRTKTKLEKRIASAKSTHDSELSGYKGALNECDKRINDIMNYPEVSVLEIEGLIAQHADLQALVGQHISGLEFLSLRPERRTLPMAKDWWEGEVQVLELRKLSVDKERTALDEGTQLWQDVLGRLEEHDRHLKMTFDVMSEYSSSKQQSPEFDDDLGEILKKQYTMCKQISHELEELHAYTETQGWKLLVTALGAEVHYFHGLKQQLGDTLHFVGWADGVVTPRPSTPRAQGNSDGLLDEAQAHKDVKTGRSRDDMGDDLAVSTIRHWQETGELRRSLSLDDDLLLSATNRHHGVEDSDNDNEVPPGLLSEIHHGNESEDEHNEVPPEFLSMHSPSPRSKDKGKGKMKVSDKNDLMKERRGNEDDEEAHHHPLSRESSANDVPPDLLAESHAFD